MSVQDFGLIIIGFIAHALLVLIASTWSSKPSRTHHATTAPRDLAELHTSKMKELL